MLADELRDAYRRGVEEKKERFDQEITDILLKCAKKGGTTVFGHGRFNLFAYELLQRPTWDLLPGLPGI